MKKWNIFLLAGCLFIFISASLQSPLLAQESQPAATAKEVAQEKVVTPNTTQPAQTEQGKPAINDIVFDQSNKNDDTPSKDIEKENTQIRSEEFIEQKITLAALSELLKCIKEDKKRIDQLDRNDKNEINKIILEKERFLLKQRDDMDHLLSPDLRKNMAASSTKQRILTACVGAGVTLLALTLLAATYDDKNKTLTWPSFNQFLHNATPVPATVP